MKKTFLIIFISLTLASCKTIKVSKTESEIFNILNKITYQHNDITDENNDYHNIADFLNKNEITKLKTWKSPEPTLENFYSTDCMGCSNDISKFTPLYKAEKGNFIHFGFKKSMGIENLVFSKKGNFVTHFFTFQGYSQLQIEKELKERDSRGYVINSIFPAIINANDIYLKHLEYSDQTNNGEWYNTTFPISLEYYINLREKQSILRFKFKGGFYSYQKDDVNGDRRMIHFFEPEFVANAVDFNEQKKNSSKTKGYYGDATFFLIKLEEIMNLSVEINSNITGEVFQFSILENNSFKTIDQYMNESSELYTAYNENLDKGEYLVRVITKKPTYWDEPLFELNIKKKKVQ